MAGIEVIQISDYYYENNLSGATVTRTVNNDRTANNFRKEFQGPDNNIYTISGNEEKSVPQEVGTAWRSLDPDVVLVRTS